MSYVAIICARDEAEHVEKAIRSVLSQSLQPLKLIIVDDDSQNGTIQRIYGYLPDRRVRLVFHKAARCKVRGVNTCIALNKGLKTALLYDSDYVLTLDADITLPVNYAEKIVSEMERDRTGLSGGFDLYARFSVEHVPNAARVYSSKLLKELYPVETIPGFDSLIKFKAMSKGFTVKGSQTRYYDNRKNSFNMGRAYFWGKSTNLIGQPVQIALVKSLRLMRTSVVGALTFLLSYVVHKLKREKIRDDAFYSWSRNYYGNLTKRGVRKCLRIAKKTLHVG